MSNKYPTDHYLPMISEALYHLQIAVIQLKESQQHILKEIIGTDVDKRTFDHIAIAQDALDGVQEQIEAASLPINQIKLSISYADAA